MPLSDCSPWKDCFDQPDAASGQTHPEIHEFYDRLRARDGGIIRYPWDGLEDFVARECGGTLRLVGYGSLMNAVSAARTIRTDGVVRQPVIAYGARRVFNYIIGDDLLERYGASPDRRQRAALNVCASASLSDAINGILIDIPIADVEALRQREQDYDLFPVICRDWQRPANAPHVAFILSVPDGMANLHENPGVEFFPHPGYLKVCREGALSVSGAFFDYFLDTTYLADQQTKLRQWFDSSSAVPRPVL